jgi:hypothetical protein
MEKESTKSSSGFAPKIGEDELSRILDLKETQDFKGLLVTFASRYRKLGWVLVAVDLENGAELALDFSQPLEIWSQYLTRFTTKGVQVGLGVRTGTTSRIFAVEAAPDSPGLGQMVGDWQSDCLARNNSGLERHFYALPPGCRLPTASIIQQEEHILVYGEGSWVFAPPTREPAFAEAWRWQTPPWVKQPRQPRPMLWQYLKRHVAGTLGTVKQEEPELPSWDEIYRLVSPCATVLQALLAPADQPEDYYQNLMKAALGVGLKDQHLLLGLLWHAPHGDALHHPDRWEYLQDLVAEGLREDAAAPAPVRPLAEPLLFLGERVTVERCRYEAVLFELRKLATKVSELEQQLAQWGQSFFPDQEGEPDKAPACFDKFDSQSLSFLQEWTDLERQVAELVESVLPSTPSAEEKRTPPTPPQGAPALGGTLSNWDEAIRQKLQLDQRAGAMEEAIEECLLENPDIAADLHKKEMLLYCLKNYINIHPDFVDRPPQEKVAEALRMAREFLGKEGQTPN